jgi:6-phosphogluconate dehydrogenase
MLDHDFSVAAYNLEPELTASAVEASGGRLLATASLAELAGALQRPRKIMLMIKAGEPVDMVLGQLKPLLDQGDIVIDGGNSWYLDTRRREQEYAGAGFRFFGVGVSGGEEGARHGPSLMPGGDSAAYQLIRPVFEAIAARTDSGACVTHVGPDGAGHFVKMVHNGIEYADMQFIAEAYHILAAIGGLTPDRLSQVFADWNRGPLESYLIEITAKILARRDPQGSGYLVDSVLDRAGQKGTGLWTAQVALTLGVPIPGIAAAIDARVLSSMKDERLRAAKVLQGPPADASPLARMLHQSPTATAQEHALSGFRSVGVLDIASTMPARSSVAKASHDALLNRLATSTGATCGLDTAELIRQVHGALYAAKIAAYAQGMALIAAGSREYDWSVNLREMARIWKGGCIIRARFLDTIMQAYEHNAQLDNLLLDAPIRSIVQQQQLSWRKVVCLAQLHGVPVPGISASLAYYDSYRAARLPQNLTQAQRDAFGAHTYQRTDDPDGPFVHSNWLE